MLVAEVIDTVMGAVNDSIVDLHPDAIISKMEFVKGLQGPDTLVYGFWLSVILLTVIYLVKYGISKDIIKSDWLHIILEFPIDLCVIIISILLTSFLKDSQFWLGNGLALATLCVAAGCCVFRRKAIKHSYNGYRRGRATTYAILDILLGVIWIYLMYQEIS